MSEYLERDVDVLLRILDHCDRITACRMRFGDDLDSYEKDLDYQDALKMNIFQIGECVNALSDALREMMTDIPWHQIYGMRNVIAHGYEKLKEERVWNTVKEDIPALEIRIREVLQDAGIDPDTF